MMILFVIAISYYLYKFVYLLFKMKQNILLPTTMDEMNTLRRFPQKPVSFPTWSNQKWGLIIYAFMLLFLIVMFILGVIGDYFQWSYFLLLFLPLTNTNNLLNIFAVLEDGILSGNRFIPWKKIKSFRFVPIDRNHKFYGYDKKVNEGYELIIKTKGSSTYCIVTSEEMRDRISKFINEHKVS